MRRYVVAGGILLLAVVAALLAGWPQRQDGPVPDAGISPIVVSVSTPPLSLPPTDETVVEIAPGVETVRLCAGTVRFVNYYPDPVILIASNHYFSSGVIELGGEYKVILPAGTMFITVLSSVTGEPVRKNLDLEVMQCGGEALP